MELTTQAQDSGPELYRISVSRVPAHELSSVFNSVAVSGLTLQYTSSALNKQTGSSKRASNVIQA